jgi:hypothetical protein
MRVSALEKASLADIKNDTFIGIAGMPKPDDSIEAFSIHIFLPAQRGVVPDRHGPWDARPNSTMTNAYVTSMVKEKDGEILTVKYKDGEKKVVVTPQTVIAAAAPAKKEEIKAGTPIIIFGWDKQPDGSVLAKTMYICRSVTPAMMFKASLQRSSLLRGRRRICATAGCRTRCRFENFDGHAGGQIGKTREVKVKLTADVTVFGITEATIADIKPGAYIGGVHPQQPDGEQGDSGDGLAESQRG